MSAAAAALLVAFAASEARADHLEACGGLFLELEAAGQCEVLTKESCEQQCEPVACERVCAARLYESCEAECSFTAEVDCQGGCEESCVPSCETEAVEQPPNCMGLCMSDCQQLATAECEGAEQHGECRSSGAQCCQEKCDAQCAEQPATECAPVCETACSGSCEASANLECQVDCQQRSFVTCKDELVQECHEQCQTTGAAIFCDGHFLLSGDLQACAQELADEFSIELDVDIDIDVDVNDDDGDADEIDEVDDVVSCSVTEPRERGVAFGLLWLIGVSAVAMRKLRRDGA